MLFLLFGEIMGINPYSSYRNFSQNSINDYGAELKKQLDVRKSQLEKLSSKDVLSNEQLARKKDLEQTVALLQKKLDRHNGIDLSVQTEKSSSMPKNMQEKSSYLQRQTYAEGSVLAKSSYPQTPYTSITPENSSYLKGFFFDTRI